MHHQLWSEQGPHFSPHSTAKIKDKSTFLRKNGSSGISDVVNGSVHSEKTSMKKLMMYDNYYYYKPKHLLVNEKIGM